MTAPAQQSIYDQIKHTLQEWGLSSLVGYLRSYLTQGMTSNEVQLHLMDTPEWKQRFAGNELRKQNGLGELTPAQYIATEQAYRQALQQYGLPTGFYDSHADFVKWIGGDVSPSEVSNRAQIAHDQYLNAPPEMKQLWQQYFGGKGDAIAMILDPKVATQVIQDRAQMVGIGGAAAAQGLNVDANRARILQQHGTTIQQAQTAYQKIAQSLPVDSQIAKRFGTTFNQADEENDLILGQGAEAQKRNILYAEEEGLFNGRASATNTTAGVSQSY